MTEEFNERRELWYLFDYQARAAERDVDRLQIDLDRAGRNLALVQGQVDDLQESLDRNVKLKAFYAGHRDEYADAAPSEEPEPEK